MSLSLLSSVLDAYDAEQAARLELATRYEIAVDAGDRLGMRRIEALAAAHELRYPSTPPVLDSWHDGIRYDTPAAA
ncbi:hypothetical protein ACFYPA_06290 [Streptomyces sp. NPDC005775]|uniref:hypothetical protein n=1 Tax=Streptomyces sp. NPDC005775 TaxID=3364729 RepID=UPI0036CA639E